MFTWLLVPFGLVIVIAGIEGVITGIDMMSFFSVLLGLAFTLFSVMATIFGLLIAIAPFFV